jgi:hypothetical protein
VRRALTLLILGAGGAILVVAPVIGHVRKTDSDVFVTSARNGNYKGKVVSPAERCERERTVRVWHDSEPAFRIGTTTTKPDGTWQLRGPEPPAGDKVYAVVAVRYLRRNSDHRHYCGRDASPKVTYPKVD